MCVHNRRKKKQEEGVLLLLLFVEEWGKGGGGGWIVIVPFYQASFNNTLQDFGFFPITSHKTSHNSGEN